MARVLLDTDILSEIIKKKDVTVAARATSYLSDEGRFTVSVLSVMEIVYGFHRLGREDRLEQFRTLISAHEVLSFEMPPRWPDGFTRIWNVKVLRSVSLT